MRQVDQVRINWEVAYASSYRISTSTDGTNFTTAADVSISQAGFRLLRSLHAAPVTSASPV